VAAQFEVVYSSLLFKQTQFQASKSKQALTKHTSLESKWGFHPHLDSRLVCLFYAFNLFYAGDGRDLDSLAKNCKRLSSSAILKGK